MVGENANEAIEGAVYYGGMVLLRLGLRVAVTTRLARDVGLLAELQAAGATLYPVFTKETIGIENRILDPRSDKRRCYQLGFVGTFRPSDLPAVMAR